MCSDKKTSFFKNLKLKTNPEVVKAFEKYNLGGNPDMLSWRLASQLFPKNALFTEGFLHEYRDKLYWQCICSCQKMSEKFILEHKEYIVWSCLKDNPNISDDFKNEYCQDLPNKSLKDCYSKEEWETKVKRESTLTEEKVKKCILSGLSKKFGSSEQLEIFDIIYEDISLDNGFFYIRDKRGIFSEALKYRYFINSRDDTGIGHLRYNSIAEIREIEED